MEVTLRAPLPGCLIALVSVMTLGLYPILRRTAERRFIRRMDDAGIETRGGARIAWRDIDGVRHVIGKVEGVTRSDEYLIHAGKRTISLPLWRIENAAAARDFLVSRLPPGVRHP